MMPDQIKKFMADHDVAKDEIWQVPGGKAYAIKHSALERIAAANRITFDHPVIIDSNTADRIVTLLVTARMGERVEWTFGEASPANCKNAYTWAMAEKRGKDRCILKLLNAHGAIYSEDEFDDAKQSAPRWRKVEQAASAETPDDEPFEGDGSAVPSHSLKKYAPDAWPQFQTAVRNCSTVTELVEVKRTWRAEISRWPEAWRNTANDVCDKHRDDLVAAREAAQ